MKRAFSYQPWNFRLLLTVIAAYAATILGLLRRFVPRSTSVCCSRAFCFKRALMFDFTIHPGLWSLFQASKPARKIRLPPLMKNQCNVGSRVDLTIRPVCWFLFGTREHARKICLPLPPVEEGRNQCDIAEGAEDSVAEEIGTRWNRTDHELAPARCPESSRFGFRVYQD